MNPELYALAAQPAVYASAFHDISSGSTECAAGDGNCGAPGESAYITTAGYDQATGLGSLDLNKLATAWPTLGPVNLTPTTVTFDGTPLAATAGSSITVDFAVNALDSPTVTPPTGNAALALDGVAISTVPLQQFTSSSTATYSLTIPSNAASGAHILSVNYPGDSTHLPSRATFALQVGTVIATGSFALSVQDISLASNGSGSTQVTVTPSGGYDGFLTWTMSITGGTVSTNYCYLIDAAPISGITTGTVHLGVGTICNSPTGLQSRSTVQRSSAAYPPAPRAARIPAAAVLAFLLVGVFPSRRRKLLPVLAVIALAALPVTLIGCGGSGGDGGGGGGNNNPPPQVYTVTLTAKDSVQTSITASTTFTLTVD